MTPRYLNGKEITGFLSAAGMMALAVWFWLSDLQAKTHGVAVTGVYSGSYERFTANTKFGGDQTSAQLLLDIVAPDGVARRVRLLDLTAFEDLPEDGTEIALIWLADQPDTARSAAAIAGPVGLNAGWLVGIAAFLFAATLADVISRRRKAA